MGSTLELDVVLKLELTSVDSGAEELGGGLVEEGILEENPAERRALAPNLIGFLQRSEHSTSSDLANVPTSTQCSLSDLRILELIITILILNSVLTDLLEILSNHDLLVL